MEQVILIPRTKGKRARFFATRKVLEAIIALNERTKDGEINNPFLQKVVRYAEVGYLKWTWLSPEWDHVFRISTTSSGLGRIIGFFNGNDFVAIGYFLKRKKKLGPTERDRIDYVAKVRKDRNWKEVPTI